MPQNQKSKNSELSGYLMLFFALQIINLVLTAINPLMNLGVYIAIITSGASLLTSLNILMVAIDILLNSLVIFFFYNRKAIFIKVYIASASIKILSTVLTLTVFSSIVASNFLNETMSILGIILNIVMLYFWLNYFKTSIQLKVYLKNTRKKPIKRHKFKVVK